jgi:hypothetical protein
MVTRPRARLVRWCAVAVALAAAAVTVPASPSAAQTPDPAWYFAFLEPLPGKDTAMLLDANDVGIAVGRSSSSALGGFDGRSTLWDRNGNAYELPSPPGWPSTAAAINDNNVVVGVADSEIDGQTERRLIVWRPGQAPQIVEGDYVGFPRKVLNTEPPVVVTFEGTVHVVGGPQIELPDDGGQIFPDDARVANGVGVVVGNLTTQAHGQRAAMWSASGMTLLAPDWPFATRAEGIGGYLVGVNYDLSNAQNPCTAATLHIGGSVTKLDPTAATSRVTDVNSFGVAVGTRRADSCGYPEGVVWVHGMHLRPGELAGVDLDLHPGTVTEQLFIYGANWMIRPP